MWLTSIIGLIIGTVGTHFTAGYFAGGDLEILAFAVIFVGLFIAAFGTHQLFKTSSEKRG